MSGGAAGGPTLASNTYSRTLTTMDSLRDTLRDEHTCLLQVPPPLSYQAYLSPSCLRTCTHAPHTPMCASFSVAAQHLYSVLSTVASM